MNDRLTGYVTGIQDYKDNDAILSVYTREYGLISLYGKGLKKITSKNAYGTQLMCRSEFLLDYNPSKSMQLLKSATLQKEFLNIRSDYQRLALASVVLEIINKINEDSLYDLLERTLTLLDESEQPYMVFSVFMSAILQLLGINPEVDRCVNCGDDKAIETISVEDGGFICRNCNKQLMLHPYLPEKLRKFRYINKASFDVYDKLLPLKLDDYELAELMVNFFMTHSGLNLRSWRSVSSEI